MRDDEPPECPVCHKPMIPYVHAPQRWWICPEHMRPQRRDSSTAMEGE